MSDVGPIDLLKAAGTLRSGRLPLGAYLDAVLARLEEVEPRMQAFVPEEGRRARLEAACAGLTERYPGKAAAGAGGAGSGVSRPPLYGVVVGIKDMFRVEGLPTRAGSKLAPRLFSGPEAGAVRRLRAAGAVVLGKTVTTEFAYFSPGPTRNPWNPAHTPGGSSSGSAAAVAAGLTPLALGTQTIGSITRPAAFCGVVGFKPSFARIESGGVIPFSRSVDHVGVFAANVRSAAAAAEVLCGGWTPREPPQGGLPAVGLLEGPYVDQAEAPARRAVIAAAERLAEAGCEVKRLTLFPDIEEINALHLDLIAREFAEAHESLYAEHARLYADRSRELIEKGRAVADDRAEAARRRAQAARPPVERMMRQAGVAVVLSPAAVGEAPAGLEATGSPIMNLPWTFLGLPTVTVPCALGPRGLPLGLQIAGCYGEDERLLAEAAGIEAVLDAPKPPA